MKEKTSTPEVEQALAQWHCLKNQLNPHFLFNSLSILSSLVRSDPALSEKFIDRLSRTYRYILEQREQTFVPLRHEMDFIRSFCFLLKIRFAEKFDLHISVPEEMLDELLILPLSLQPLIENAIRFNRMSQKDPLIVDICLQEDWLVVKNGLKLRIVPGGHEGGSLANLIHRYHLVSDLPVSAGISDDHFFVKIPMMRAQH